MSVEQVAVEVVALLEAVHRPFAQLVIAGSVPDGHRDLLPTIRA
jgi:hypothetical protein